MKEIDPLNFLKAVYMDAKLPLSVRMRAAVELLPFTHPKLAVTAVVREQDFATLLDQRIKKWDAMNGQTKSQVIDQPQIEAPKHLPRVADRRFRRM